MRITLLLAAASIILTGCGNNQLAKQNADLLQQVNTLSNSLAVANASIADMEKKLRVPVIESYRKASAGDGYVLEFWNASVKTLPITVQVERPGIPSKTWTMVLPPLEPPAQKHEIGWMQGWAAAPGDKITVASDGFTDAHFVLRAK